MAAETLVKFTDKASYFDWVSGWKEFYKSLATRQRHLRIELSKSHAYLEYHKSGSVAGMMSERHVNKLWLTILLEARQIGKRLSWQIKKQLQQQ